jgi:hypothetical protein
VSRSRPRVAEKNPASRWFEWSGQDGILTYYDKDAKEKVRVDLPVTFIALDTRATVGGWHDDSQSGIYANEVASTKDEPLTVKAFKGGTLAEGLYRDIKDQVRRVGGHYVSVCYVAFKEGDTLSLGAVKFKGSALRAWMEFTQDHSADLFTKAFTISGFDQGKKGSITFRTPTFRISELSEETADAARGLDERLQVYLDGYAAKRSTAPADGHDQRMHPEPDEDLPPLEDDDIPF